jgi:hypothetical protein
MAKLRRVEIILLSLSAALALVIWFRPQNGEVRSSLASVRNSLASVRNNESLAAVETLLVTRRMAKYMTSH